MRKRKYLRSSRKRRLKARSPNPLSSIIVRNFRHYLGLPQAAFAKQLDIKRLSVSRWEIGDRAPSRVLTKRLHELAAMNGVELARMSDPEYVTAMRSLRDLSIVSQPEPAPESQQLIGV